MPTIIDSLVVELGFDVDGVDAGRKRLEGVLKKTSQSAVNTGKDIENSAKRSGDFLMRLRNNVLSLFAAFTAGRGIKDFLSEMTTTDAALGRFSRNVGMSANEVAAWRAAGSLMGVDAKDIDSTFSNLTQQFEQFSVTGDSAVIPYWRALKVAMTDAKGEMLPLPDLLMKLSRATEGMRQSRAINLLTGAGISPGMQQLILKGPEAMQKFVDSQKALADAQARDAPAAEARQQVWNDFINQATAVGVVLLESLTPALITITNLVKGLAVVFQEHPELAGMAFAALTGVVLALSAAIGVTLVAGALSLATAGFGALLGGIVPVATGLATLTATALPALSAAFYALAGAMMLTPIPYIVAGIAALSVIGYELYKHWEDIRKWWRSLWGDMGNDAEEGSEKVQDGVKKMEPAGKGAKGGAGAGGPVAIPSGPQAEADIAAMEKMGWTRAQATGIVANLTAESGGRTDRVGDNGQAFGLAQWHADRQAKFKAWAGKDIREATRQEQLAFVNYELRGPEARAGAILAQTDTAEHAARAVNTYYERPKDVPGQNAVRSAIASTLAGGGAANTARAGNYNHQSSETHIAKIEVHTQATDAPGIARDIKPAMQRDNFVQQANYGPT